MGRKRAKLPGGARLSDYLSVGVIARVFPVDAVRAALTECGRSSRRRRLLPAEAVVYYVIAQALFRSVSAREVLRCVAEGLRWLRAGTRVRIASKGAISRARTRLGSEPLRVLHRLSVRVLAKGTTRGAWYAGLRLVAYDGTTLDVPDEERNRKRYGFPGTARGQAAFPKARLTALVELGTRVAFAWVHGPYRQSERSQAERLHAHLEPGMLLLADRGYIGLALWRSAAQTGSSLLWRAKSKTPLPVEQVLEDGSFRTTYADMPVRVVEYTIPESGDRVYRLVTTLHDPQQAPAVELAALYHERWEIETAYDEIKTHILGRNPILRAKTPTLVEQEIEGLMLAHFAVRSFLHEAALAAKEDPDRLSFTHAVQVIRRRVQNPGAFPPCEAEPAPAACRD